MIRNLPAWLATGTYAGSGATQKDWAQLEHLSIAIEQHLNCAYPSHVRLIGRVAYLLKTIEIWRDDARSTCTQRVGTGSEYLT